MRVLNQNLIKISLNLWKNKFFKSLLLAIYLKQHFHLNRKKNKVAKKKKIKKINVFKLIKNWKLNKIKYPLEIKKKRKMRMSFGENSQINIHIEIIAIALIITKKVWNN